MTPDHVGTDPTRQPLRRARREPSLPLATETVDRWPGPDDQARADAVDDARAVLEAGWQRWVAEAGLDPVPALRCREPRVTVVGDRPERYRPVALIRFTFTAEGSEFRGCARGPAEAPYFTIQRVLGVGETRAEPSRRHWWRRRG